jgi:hypothetical protein
LCYVPYPSFHVTFHNILSFWRGVFSPPHQLSEAP